MWDHAGYQGHLRSISPDCKKRVQASFLWFILSASLCPYVSNAMLCVCRPLPLCRARRSAAEPAKYSMGYSGDLGRSTRTNPWTPSEHRRAMSLCPSNPSNPSMPLERQCVAVLKTAQEALKSAACPCQTVQMPNLASPEPLRCAEAEAEIKRHSKKSSCSSVTN